MKNFIILILFFSISCICGYSQNTVSFTYDVNGNRTSVSRNFSLSSVVTKSNKGEKEAFSDNIDNHGILIYPNPVKEKFTVKFKDVDPEDKLSLKLFDSNGKTLKIIDPAQRENTIKMEDMNAGLYILEITVNEKSEKWKVIKE